MARIAVDEAFHRAIVHPCDCKAGVCTSASETQIGGRWLDLCPYTYLRDPYWAAVCSLLAAARVSPVAGWPDGYPAGIVAGVLALRHALDERSARDQREAYEKAKRG